MKSHFVFNRGERNGIFLLVIIIIALQAGFFFIDLTPSEPISLKHQEEMERFQQQVDSLKQIKALSDTAKIFPFNPNFITDYKGYTLGLSPEEIDRLHAFRAQDKWINSEEDFQKVTKVSDSTLIRISTYFKFPEWVENSKAADVLPIRAVPKQDLNAATAEHLKQVTGVGAVLSVRIVRYRESLGGFRDEIQLHDVYGLAPEVMERIEEKFFVRDFPLDERPNLNTISVILLSEMPYFNYELARKVVEYRKLHEEFKSYEELSGIPGFPLDRIDRIKLYLAIY